MFLLLLSGISLADGDRAAKLFPEASLLGHLIGPTQVILMTFSSIPSHVCYSLFWLNGFFYQLLNGHDWLIDWLNDWLIDWLIAFVMADVGVYDTEWTTASIPQHPRAILSRDRGSARGGQIPHPGVGSRGVVDPVPGEQFVSLVCSDDHSGSALRPKFYFPLWSDRTAITRSRAATDLGTWLSSLCTQRKDDGACFPQVTTVPKQDILAVCPPFSMKVPVYITIYLEVRQVG